MIPQTDRNSKICGLCFLFTGESDKCNAKRNGMYSKILVSRPEDSGHAACRRA